jgi:hypothetical protein
MTAPAIEGGAIQPNRRQLIRPARMCVVEAVAAAMPETAMFAPPALAGDEAASRKSGSRRLPSTRPTAPPARATANDQAPTPTSSSPLTARPYPHNSRGPPVGGPRRRLGGGECY